MLRLLIIAVVPLFVAGCATPSQFFVVGPDEYMLWKHSDACAAGLPSSALDHIRDEAVRFCAGRRETFVEIESTTEMGIPVIRCTSAMLKFSCKPAPR